jgi:shikimate dehydrogenase
MLMHQARPGFAAWFGVEPKVTPALRDHLVALLQGR